MLTRKEFHKAFGFSNDLFGSLYGRNVEHTTKRLHARWAISEEVAKSIAELKHEAVQYYHTHHLPQTGSFADWFADTYARRIERGDPHELEVAKQRLKCEAEKVVEKREEQWRKRHNPTPTDKLKETLEALEDPDILEGVRRIYQTISAEGAENNNVVKVKL